MSSFRDYHLGERRKSYNKQYLSRLLGPLQVTENSIFLDLGCGSGYVNNYLVYLLPLHQNIGMDLDFEALQLARELNAHATRILWACASGEAIPLRDASVDHVVCRGVVPLVRVERVLAEVSRILRPGGTVVFLMHSWEFYVRRLSLRPKHWKRTVSGLAILLLGAWFNLTGRQIQPQLGQHRITQSFQTEFRICRLMRKHGLTVSHVVRKPEFLVYART